MSEDNVLVDITYNVSCDLKQPLTLYLIVAL